jgi:TolB-like protein/DNA-binding winged helix-turn-helix (wHTH) protein/Flp pilus assembly protein TadD
MASPAANPQIIRFGAYEVDLRTGELRKHGLRIKLQDQPFQILAMLLERPAELLTREQIKERLWPAETFVDFDHSVNTAIRRLRDALSDSADNPRFIETLPRRGYRFIGEVQGGGDGASQPSAPSDGSGAAALDALGMLQAAEALAAEAQEPAVEIPAARRRSAAVGIALIVIVAATLVAGVVVWISSPRSPIDSIAVLPFANATGDAGLDYLSDGIAENVMADLSQVPMLKVMSRNSVFRYKGKTVDPKQAARELGVGAVLLGTMRQQGDQLRISLELVNAADGRQLWGADFEHARADAVQMERDISQQTSDKLRIRLGGEQHDRLVKRHVPPPEAYELFLRGRQALGTGRNIDRQRGLELLQRAINVDPDYAEAYIEMSAAYASLEFYGGMQPREARASEEGLLRRARELSPDSIALHVQMGYFLARSRDFPGAEREWKRAIEMEPNSADAHRGYSLILVTERRFDDALREAYLTEKIDPLWPGSYENTAWILYCAHRYDEARKRALNSGRDFAPAYWILGLIGEQQGRHQEALDALQQAVKLDTNNSFSLASLAHAYATAGRNTEAREVLAKLLELHRTSYYSPANIAVVYLGLGDRSNSLKWLQMAYEQQDHWLYRAMIDPRFDSLHNDPAFLALKRDLKLRD